MICAFANVCTWANVWLGGPSRCLCRGAPQCYHQSMLIRCSIGFNASTGLQHGYEESIDERDDLHSDSSISRLVKGADCLKGPVDFCRTLTVGVLFVFIA